MARRTVDVLAEAATPPEELSGLLVEDSGFLSRPCILPDELRGALLLPSEEGSYSAGRTFESSVLDREEGKGEEVEEDIDAGSSPLSCRASEAIRGWRGSGSSEPVAAVSSSPDPSSGTSAVGLRGAQDLAGSLSQSSKSNRSRDWSLSDTDLRELLEQQSVPELVGLGCAGNLTSVPEAAELLGHGQGGGCGPPRQQWQQQEPQQRWQRPAGATADAPQTACPEEPLAGVSAAAAVTPAGSAVAPQLRSAVAPARGALPPPSSPAPSGSGSAGRSQAATALVGSPPHPATARSSRTTTVSGSPPQSSTSRSYTANWTSLQSHSSGSLSLASGGLPGLAAELGMARELS